MCGLKCLHGNSLADTRGPLDLGLSYQTGAAKSNGW